MTMRHGSIAMVLHLVLSWRVTHRGHSTVPILGSENDGDFIGVLRGGRREMVKDLPWDVGSRRPWLILLFQVFPKRVFIFNCRLGYSSCLRFRLHHLNQRHNREFRQEAVDIYTMTQLYSLKMDQMTLKSFGQFCDLGTKQSRRSMECQYRIRENFRFRKICKNNAV